MSNWFEDHPARSIVVHTIVVAGTVWAAFAFIFDENKVAVYRAEVENEKATASQYRAKTETLEVELARLREENRKYLEWLGNTPHTIPFLEQRIKVLTEENTRQGAQLAAMTAVDTSRRAVLPPPLYSSTKVLNIGESFVDSKTGASLGIGRISYDFTASVTSVRFD